MFRSFFRRSARSVRKAFFPSSQPRRSFRFDRQILWTDWLEDRITPSLVLGQQPGAPNYTQFHGDAARTGFNQTETLLSPANVASGFGQVWQSPVLDGRLYATPLFA